MYWAYGLRDVLLEVYILHLFSIHLTQTSGLGEAHCHEYKP